MATVNRVSVYLAGPLFTQAEWQWNERLAKRLQDGGLHVIVPQRDAEPMLKGTKPFDPKFLFMANLEKIEKADAVVAIFDGADVDSGTSWECGYAFKAHRPVIAVRTDIRAGGDDPKAATNLMLSCCCAAIVSAPPAERDNVEMVAAGVIAAVHRVVRNAAILVSVANKPSVEDSAMTDTKADYADNMKFYTDYAGYLAEPQVRKVHDAVFNAVGSNPSLRRVIDLGCGKGNEFFYHGRPDFYLGVDQIADVVNEAHRVIEKLDYRTSDTVKLRIKEWAIIGVVSLFSAEITAPSNVNHAFYEELFRDTGVNAILIAGFYYKHLKEQEKVNELRCLVSYQTKGTIDRPDTKLFHETRIEIPCPSSLFGDDVVEVYRLLQRPDHYDAASAEALKNLAPEGYSAETRMALG